MGKPRDGRRLAVDPILKLEGYTREDAMQLRRDVAVEAIRAAALAWLDLYPPPPPVLRRRPYCAEVP